MIALRRLWVRLTVDRTRFATLCGITAVGLLLWARLILVSDLPRTAIADPEADAAGGSAGSAATAASAPTESPLRRVTLVDVPGRDPFTTDPRHFPDPHDRQGLPPDGEKSGEPQADETSAGAARSVLIAAALERRRLEAALPSAGIAVIDGRNIRLGEHLVLDGLRVRLRVIEVRQRSVLLAPEGGDGGERFVLRMSGPGG